MNSPESWACGGKHVIIYCLVYGLNAAKFQDYYKKDYKRFVTWNLRKWPLLITCFSGADHWIIFKANLLKSIP